MNMKAVIVLTVLMFAGFLAFAQAYSPEAEVSPDEEGLEEIDDENVMKLREMFETLQTRAEQTNTSASSEADELEDEGLDFPDDPESSEESKESSEESKERRAVSGGPQCRSFCLGCAVYIQSVNYPRHFMSLKRNEVWITPRRYIFLIRKGLFGRGTYSLESYYKPNYYVRHYGGKLYLENASHARNQHIMAKDASFYLRRNFWRTGNDIFTFESVNYRSHFIRHAGYRLSISRRQNSQLYKLDSSWRIKNYWQRA